MSAVLGVFLSTEILNAGVRLETVDSSLGFAFLCLPRISAVCAVVGGGLSV